MSGSRDSDASNEAWVVLGKVGKVHGIKGWVRVISFTEVPDGILDYPVLRAEFDRSLAPASASRLLEEEARLLNGATLSVERQALPELESDEYYWYQLEGLTVVNRQNECFGVIKSMLETGANDVMVVTATEESIDDRERLIPYLSDSVVQKVDLDEGIIRVDWEADYLA